MIEVDIRFYFNVAAINGAFAAIFCHWFVAFSIVLFAKWEML